ncbi:hypothetical protein GVAV_000183 [Gurleya vavrai]
MSETNSIIIMPGNHVFSETDIRSAIKYYYQITYLTHLVLFISSTVIAVNAGLPKENLIFGIFLNILASLSGLLINIYIISRIFCSKKLSRRDFIIPIVVNIISGILLLIYTCYLKIIMLKIKN